uniref:Putative secreted protein n=1 Tax=Ixodes ricinus TaxID=34613 RepID=A0A6B0ULL5_IXORI
MALRRLGGAVLLLCRLPSQQCCPLPARPDVFLPLLPVHGVATHGRLGILDRTVLSFLHLDPEDPLREGLEGRGPAPKHVPEGPVCARVPDAPLGVGQEEHLEVVVHGMANQDATI